MSFILRDYQQEDVDAIIAAHQTHQCVLGRAATGLGKAVELAAIAQHYAQFGRVMILVDVAKLVRQLAATVRDYTGMSPGIEMANSCASDFRLGWDQDQIIVSTVQSQYSGKKGNERYRKFQPNDFSCVLLDECEAFLADRASEVVQWYLQNPKIRVYGCSATPMRTDGVAMANLFDTVAIDRDILWGIDNGFLVPAKQAYVRVSIDFGSLKIRKSDTDEKDYSEDDIGNLLLEEANLIELSKGIHHVCGDRKSIVVCPNVASAKALTHYLDAEKSGCAQCIYGELSDEEKDLIFDAHQNNKFQFLVSVMMLTKGYDDKTIKCVVNCRKTRSKRLYQQIVGRGTRPLSDVVDGPPDAESRKAAIAASDKPEMLMVNMIGIDSDVRDMTIVDILGAKQSEEVRTRAKQRMMQDDSIEMDAEKELIEADEALRAEEEEEETKRREAEAARERRRRIQVDAHVDVEYQSDFRMNGSAGVGGYRGLIPERQLSIFRKAKLTEVEIAKLSPSKANVLSQEIVRRWKQGLCSWGQAKLLRKYGFTRDSLHDMSFEAAGAEITKIKANGWRPT
jgi:superfamily II DNA or RNA helicase